VKRIKTLEQRLESLSLESLKPESKKRQD